MLDVNKIGFEGWYYNNNWENELHVRNAQICIP